MYITHKSIQNYIAQKSGNNKRMRKAWRMLRNFQDQELSNTPELSDYIATWKIWTLIWVALWKEISMKVYEARDFEINIT